MLSPVDDVTASGVAGGWRPAQDVRIHRPVLGTLSNISTVG